MMCEWLSREEWCDVQLLCGGRAFSAHRLVLASVSTFLRKVFLSCPIEESPIYIVLPDFDLEAMSSVLYYIYNGEVIIHKQKMEMFFEIVKAMQIFIDQQCLKQIGNIVYKPENCLDTHGESDLYKSSSVFVLSSENSKDQQYITLKKGQEIKDILLQCSFRDSDHCDKQMRCRNWSEQYLPCLGNLQSPYRDRQRNSFLRDSFIETYPRNGNANGQTASVPAISNERYREPTSVFLTNANGKYSRADDALSETSKETTVSIAPLQLPFEQNYKILHDVAYSSYFQGVSNAEKKSSTEFNIKMFQENSNLAKHINDSCIDVTLQSPRRLLPIGLPEHTLVSNHVSSLDLRVTHLISQPKSHQVANTKNLVKTTKTVFRNFPCNSSNIESTKIESNGILTKGAILNKVLESPWCPRIPKNYKLFRRKDETNVCAKVKDNTTATINDKNNNIKVTTPIATPSDLVKERFSANDTKEIMSNSYSIASLIGKDDFKCMVCNQVFTSAESLSTHMKRHTSARYSCTECDKTFSQLRNYKYHMSVHRGTREFAATCTVCGKYFNDRGYLSSHMKIHRNRKEYKCSQCPKSFNQRVAYNMHVRIHTGVKPHVCGECGKAFSRKMLLKQHQRTHSGERPYACAHCGKRFADRSNMTLHLRLHTGIKPFSCTLCSKSFTKKHHLKSHLNFHTGAKPYACPRCKLAFTQSSNMRTHLKKCNAPEPVPVDAEEAASAL